MSAAAVPAQVCGRCGEYAPHACAPAIVRTRERFTGARGIVITDRVGPGYPSLDPGGPDVGLPLEDWLPDARGLDQ